MLAASRRTRPVPRLVVQPVRRVATAPVPAAGVAVLHRLAAGRADDGADRPVEPPVLWRIVGGHHSDRVAARAAGVGGPGDLAVMDMVAERPGRMEMRRRLRVPAHHGAPVVGHVPVLTAAPADFRDAPVGASVAARRDQQSKYERAAVYHLHPSQLDHQVCRATAIEVAADQHVIRGCCSNLKVSRRAAVSGRRSSKTMLGKIFSLLATRAQAP